MPALLPDGLVIAGVLPREDPLDAVVLPRTAHVMTMTPSATTPSFVTSIDTLVAMLGQEPTIGTSSVRRVAQLTRLFPGARFEPIRGNLDTRLRKLDERQYDAIVLASAGLRRLGFAERISMALPPSACVPAPGQGIVAIEVRADAVRVREIVATMSDADALAALDAERAVVDALGGGCQTPIGALATEVDGELDLVAAVVALDGSRAVRTRMRGLASAGRLLRVSAGEELLAQGAAEILAEAHAATAAGQRTQNPNAGSAVIHEVRAPSHDE